MSLTKPQENRPTCNCKIGKVARERDLDDLNSHIRRWYVEEDESLRAVARKVNVHILSTVMNDIGGRGLGPPETVYEALVSEEADATTTATVRDKLSFLGVNVDTLTEQFISHMTVKQHLNEFLDVDTSYTGATDPPDVLDHITDRLDIVENVIDRGIHRLLEAGNIRLPDDYTITVTARVRCHECARTTPPQELIRTGGCDCTVQDDDTDAVMGVK
jgi:hypothetical protein